MSELGAFTLMLAALASRLAEHARTVRGFPGVKAVNSAVSPRLYRSGARIESYVDAELAGGNAVAWWLELREDTGSWIVESSVLHTTSAGQDAICELPVRYAVGADDLAREVDGATGVLLSSIGKEDVQRL